jgi:hypothetical protein
VRELGGWRAGTRAEAQGRGVWYGATDRPTAQGAGMQGGDDFMAKNSRVRRSYSQIFMEKLSALSKGQQTLIGNGALREELGWDERRYQLVKRQLKDENSVIVGKGRGGTVGLANAPGTKAALSAFIAYSHEDKGLKDGLLRHLKPLARRNLVETWHDQEIKPGDEWDSVISRKLESSAIILLLVSIDFINSDYCYGVEVADSGDCGQGFRLIADSDSDRSRTAFR